MISNQLCEFCMLTDYLLTRNEETINRAAYYRNITTIVKRLQEIEKESAAFDGTSANLMEDIVGTFLEINNKMTLAEICNKLAVISERRSCMEIALFHQVEEEYNIEGEE